MSASFRGLVDQYADETGKTMPQAYKDLMEAGLAVVDVELDNFDPDVDLPPEVKTVSQLDNDRYELIIKEEKVWEKKT